VPTHTGSARLSHTSWSLTYSAKNENKKYKQQTVTNLQDADVTQEQISNTPDVANTSRILHSLPAFNQARSPTNNDASTNAQLQLNSYYY